jgi:glycosyltransferase involved in cell wall biosynthesis
MSRGPLVSVIIPFLNTPRQFLKEAIESVLAQSYGNWEILLVDDGSSADSTTSAREYCTPFSDRMRYLEHEGHRNRGLSASRMLGISEAAGEYIAFLDADDVWLPHKLEQQVALMEIHRDAAILYGNTQYWFSWTGRPEDAKRDFVPRLGVRPNTLIAPPALLPLFLRGKAAVPCPSSILIRRRVVEQIGGFEDAFRTMYEDQVFYAKVCLAAPVFVADACWDRYRQHPDSVCAVAEINGRTLSDRQIFLTWLKQYLDDRQVTHPEVWHALRAELRRYNDRRWPDVPGLADYLKRRAAKLMLRLRS